MWTGAITTSTKSYLQQRAWLNTVQVPRSGTLMASNTARPVCKIVMYNTDGYGGKIFEKEEHEITQETKDKTYLLICNFLKVKNIWDERMVQSIFLYPSLNGFEFKKYNSDFFGGVRFRGNREILYKLENNQEYKPQKEDGVVIEVNQWKGFNPPLYTRHYINRDNIGGFVKLDPALINFYNSSFKEFRETSVDWWHQRMLRKIEI